MKRKRAWVIIFFILIFFAASLGKPVFAERANPELEFFIDNARKEISKQEAIVRTLRKRYEDILKRKKALQQFIDEENKRIDEFKLSKNKPSAKPVKTAPVCGKRQDIRITGKVSKESPVLREEKKLREQETARRNAVQNEILRQQEKEENRLKQLPQKQKPGKPVEAKKKIGTEAKKKEQSELEKRNNEAARVAAQKKAKETELKIKKQEQVEFLAEQKAKEKKAKEIIDKQRQAALVKKQEKEKELLSKKLEKERLLAEEKEQRQMRERECQMKLLLEADKNAKHERYVSQLGQLLNRQNCLLEESRKLESQIRAEEENLKVLERTREELIRKILENS
jgi:hypothetical protein